MAARVSRTLYLSRAAFEVNHWINIKWSGSIDCIAWRLGLKFIWAGFFKWAEIGNYIIFLLLSENYILVN